MNQPYVKETLGADPSIHAPDCVNSIQADFKSEAQAVADSVSYLPEIINGGVRLLVFAGDVGERFEDRYPEQNSDNAIDAACNYIGNERWMLKLEHDFHGEFVSAPSTPWRVGPSGGLAGEVRSAGGGAGNVTFIRVYEAG